MNAHCPHCRQPIQLPDPEPRPSRWYDNPIGFITALILALLITNAITGGVAYLLLELESRGAKQQIERELQKARPSP